MRENWDILKVALGVFIIVGLGLTAIAGFAVVQTFDSITVHPSIGLTILSTGFGLVALSSAMNKYTSKTINTRE